MRIAVVAILAFLQFLSGWRATLADDPLQPPDSTTLAELAPTGKLRVGLFRSATFEDGFGADLAAYLGGKIGVPVESRFFRDLKAFLNCAMIGECDVIAVGVTPDREKLLQFTPVFMELETTYLVRADARFQNIDDLDQPGVTISVYAGSVVDQELTARLHHAKLDESTVSEQQRANLLVAGKVDAIADNADQLARWSRMAPGSRVISGHFGIVRYGLATALGKPAAGRYLSSVIDDSVASGAMTEMIKARGLRGHVPEY
jgi:polar amino acid transport system substrate-binding protein